MISIRLYPREIYEIIRIIKIVANLPFVTYLVAWDSSYIEKSLEKEGVPFPSGYLDKIIQVRLPLPGMTFTSKYRVFRRELRSLEHEESFSGQYDVSQLNEVALVLLQHFPGLISTPREIVRLANTMKIYTRPLWGEIDLFDLFAMSAIITVSPDIYELIKNQPDMFLEKKDVLVEEGDDNGQEEGNDFNRRLHNAADSTVIRNLLGALFPQLGINDVLYRHHHHKRICDSKRLGVFLQQQIAEDHVSFVEVNSYMENISERKTITDCLHNNNFVDFLDAIVSYHKPDESHGYVEAFVKAVAMYPDLPKIVELNSSFEKMADFFGLSPWFIVQGTVVRSLVLIKDNEDRKKAFSKIVSDPETTSMAASLLNRYGRETDDQKIEVDFKECELEELQAILAENIANGLRQRTIGNLSAVLFWVSGLDQEKTIKIRKLAESDKELYENMVVAVLSIMTDSHKGLVISYPDKVEQLDSIFGLKELNKRAAKSLKTNADSTVWNCIIDQTTVYWCDGSPAESK